MTPNSLQEFIDALDSAGELKRIDAPVDPVLEITEIADRVVKGGGPALLFTRPRGSNFPVLINAFASWKRVSIALGGRRIEQVAEEIRELTRLAPPRGFGELMRAGSKAWGLFQSIPRSGRGPAPCQEVVMDPPDITAFPVLQCWPEDGGRYITLPLVFSKDPRTGRRNCGMYRIQVFDATTTAMHWQIHKVGARHFADLEGPRTPGVIRPGPPPKIVGDRLDVAVAIGADPLTIYSATAPLPEEIDEMLFAGFLRKRPVEMVKCKTVDLEVPAASEIVLEGYVTPHERRLEGPFGDHTGFYSLAEMYPVFHVTAITHRRRPTYIATIVGRPPMEDGWLGKMTERLFLPLLQTQLPELVDMNLPVDGIFHNLAIVSIRKRFPGHAFRVMSALWGLGQMSLTKCIIVLDHDADVQNLGEVLWRVGNNIDPERDTQFVKGPVDVLDHASRGLGFGSKLGIDATRKWPEEGFNREWPDELKMTSEVRDKIDRLWPDLELDSWMKPDVHPDRWRGG